MPQQEGDLLSANEDTLFLNDERCIRSYAENRVRDEDILWRRILNNPNMLKTEPSGSLRPSSAAFLDGRTGEVSVQIARLTTAEKALSNKADNGIVELEASYPRSLGHIVAYDPVKYDPDLEDDVSHALIWSPEKSPKQRKADARLMAEKSRWLCYPKDYRPEKLS